MAAWKNDEWYYCGVILSVAIDGIVLDDHAASLWGIEANDEVGRAQIDLLDLISTPK